MIRQSRLPTDEVNFTARIEVAFNERSNLHLRTAISLGALLAHPDDASHHRYNWQLTIAVALLGRSL